MPLSDNNRAYQALFQHSSLGIIVSNGEGVIEQVNPFANKLFGYEGQELVGQKIEVLIPRRMKERHVSHRTSYHEKPRPRSMGIGMDLWAVRKDGTEFPVEISLANYEDQGNKLVVSFINDITERKKAEDELKRLNTELELKVQDRTNELSQAILELQHTNASLSQAEEEARHAYEKERELSELKSRFVSMASHEFRTPLSGILTSAALIARYDAPADKEKRHKHVQTIRTSVQNLTNILNDFLSLDKLEHGRVECRPSEFSLSALAHEVADEIRAVAPQKIDLSSFSPQAEDDLVRLDKDMVRNILLNLLSNAMKYSPSDKSIFLKAGIQGDIVVLTVQDGGIGIPEAEQKHLFEKFFRAHNAVNVQGTGLGLNIVRRYLDLLGGAITFTSKENEGTTFTVTLPRRVGA